MMTFQEVRKLIMSLTKDDDLCLAAIATSMVCKRLIEKVDEAEDEYVHGLAKQHGEK